MPRKKRHLILPKTCRQIHAETRGLIFAHSPLFCWLEHMVLFLMNTPLTPVQMHAIRHLRTSVGYHGVEDITPSSMRLGIDLRRALAATKELAGLVRITIAFHGSYCEFGWDSAASSLRKEVERCLKEIGSRVKVEVVDGFLAAWP